MRVRPARPGDAETLRTAVSRGGETTVFDDTGAPILDVSAAGVREAAAAADCCFLVEEGGRPVGLALAHPDHEGAEAELLSLWVHPEFLGEGIAARLLERVARSLREQGIERLRTTAAADAASAREFFAAKGFSHRETSDDRDGHEVVMIAALEDLL
ncbi:hypothetical protein GCM10027435_13860 [Haloparvum alkalitolerans]|uniref:GNAT family N-acetyltransferase n=1 Tax=Haloparvum alkalitolerans TaxID=1042953 RepID=UPI003CE6FEAD